MTDPLVAPRRPAKKAPAVVDIRSEWHFGYSGKVIKAALMEKVARLEASIVTSLEQVSREVGDDPKAITTLLVTMHGDSMNVKARYVKDLCVRVVELQKERDKLARAARGFSSEITYVIAIEDMEEMGL